MGEALVAEHCLHGKLDLAIGVGADHHEKRVSHQFSLDMLVAKVAELFESSLDAASHVAVEKAIDGALDLVVGQLGHLERFKLLHDSAAVDFVETPAEQVSYHV